VASVVMLLGWGILAVPTGIVTAEMTTRRMSEADRPRPCPSCARVIHAAEARFCHHCGAPLE
jgi:voltage-gated potassium channel